VGAIVLTLASVVPATTVDAADPLAAAEARITAAQAAADRATAAFDAAQERYYQLEDDAKKTEQAVAALKDEVARLGTIARARAIVAYKGGAGSPLDDLVGMDGTAIEAARRALLVDQANAKNQATLEGLRATNEDLHLKERTLRQQLDDQSKALDDLKSQQAEMQNALASAKRAADQLRAQLERERRAAEYASRLRQAQAAARRQSANVSSSNGGGGGSTRSGGGAGQIIVSGSWVCPVQGPVSFSDTYGSPRGGGRTHKGVDMFAARGTPVVAVVSGSVWYQSDPAGGNAAYVDGNDGNTYYYAHLNDYVGGQRAVSGGEVIGHVGNTGTSAPPHLHFEIRPGGANGPRPNPYPTVAAHC
jgi:murein DD-endopeptidase MepM/ murein hydrolase activator NlpD